jgi:FkbM family methyltransferase
LCRRIARAGAVTDIKERKRPKMLRNAIRSPLKLLLQNVGYPTYTAKHGLAKGFKVTGDLGFLQLKDWTVTEECFLQSLDLKGKTVYDIGAHIGIMTMFFSRAVGKVGRVVAFEPNPGSCVRLRQNLDLNRLKNVEIATVGLGDKRETKTLVFDRFSAGAGSMDDEIKSKILSEKGSKALQVQAEIYTLDEYVKTNRWPEPDFIKIDVEGMEYKVLMGMTEIIHNYAPDLFIEIHGVTEAVKLENVQRVVEFLDSCTYTIDHVESGQTISMTTAYIAKGGHIYCTQTALLDC